MVTHTLYDFLAFGFILISWAGGEDGEGESNPVEER